MRVLYAKEERKASGASVAVKSGSEKKESTDYTDSHR
jgi:hypothetical protein